MAGSKTTNTLKSALVVVGAIAFGWLSIELAFKPFLNRAREALDKADPARDTDDQDDAASKPSKNSSESSSDVAFRNTDSGLWDQSNLIECRKEASQGKKILMQLGTFTTMRGV
ncbi:hypothetical protein ACLOJK_017475 [Asimina triloba]